MKTLCIIPCYNEEKRLIKFLNRIKQFKKKRKDIDFFFIDDGSTDQSANLIKKNKFKLKKLKKNTGVGKALIEGYLYAKKNKYSILVHLAGNGKMDPFQIEKMIKPIKEDNCDFVSGSRFLKKGGTKNTPFYRLFLIYSFSFLISIIFRKKITDASCGFRAFRTNIFNNFNLKYNHKKLYTYGYEYYTFGKIISQNNKKFKEISVSMNYPSRSNYTKMRPVVDWLVIVYYWFLGYYDKNKI